MPRARASISAVIVAGFLLQNRDNKAATITKPQRKSGNDHRGRMARI
jgi:hypothetical protein